MAELEPESMYANAWRRELAASGLLSAHWHKTHQIDALVLVTRDLVAERDRYRALAKRLGGQVNQEYRASIGEVWHWLGDGTDDLDTLCCPVLIEPGALQNLLTPPRPAPIPMLLYCPGCHARHIDVGEFATRPHHTHACQACGMVWRPALVDTVGVEFLPGFKDVGRQGVTAEDSSGLKNWGP